MLYTYGNVLVVNMIRILSLKGFRLSHRHLSVQVRVFTITLPLPWPDRIPAEVHHRREHPRNHSGPCLVSHDLTHRTGIFTIECRREVYLLREKGSVVQVACAVDHIKTIDARDSDLLHRLFLDLAHKLSRQLT